MTVEVPDPVPLEMPPGNAGVLAEVVGDVAGAAYHLDVLAGSLVGPAASAPGWVGDDAAAAVAEIGVAATLARRTADAVLAAMHRLSAHAECLSDARRQVAALAQEQREDFAAAWARLHALENPRLAIATGSPAWMGPIEDLRASEESRRRRHAVVLDAVADDAAATARVLADSSAAIGGRGAPDDSSRVLAHFAAELPGWGDGELAARGRALADAFVHEWLTPQAHDERARDAAALAGSAAFAEAFLTGLGEEGLRATLILLGDGDFGADSPLAGLLVAALGAAGPTGFPVRAAAVVQASYVDPVDVGVDPDRVVLGMAVVLAAAATGRAGRLPPTTVAAWGRQTILREHHQGAPAIDRFSPMSLSVPPVDAVPLVVELLGRDSGGAAGLLTEPDVWRVLLARTWDDGGADLGRLVHLAGSDAGPDGGTALRAGLEALGTGLDDGDPEDWTVVPGTAAAVVRPLAHGMSTHWTVPAGILAAGADGATGERDGDRLRGLGYLSIDPAAAAAVADGLTTWVAHQPPDITALVTAKDLAVVAVPAAWLAVQEYGQRLDHALRAFELEAAAEERAWKWNATVGLLSQLGRGPWAAGVGALEPLAARLFGADGSWEGEPDTGAVFRREDAARDARVQTPLRAPADVAALSAQARSAFDGTARVLGRPEPPTPPDTSWGRTLLEVVAKAGPIRSADVLERLGRRHD